MRFPRGNPGAALVVALALGAGACSTADAPGPGPTREVSPPELPPVSASAAAAAPSAAPQVSAGYDITTASSVTVVVTKRRPLDPIDYVPAGLVELTALPDGDGKMLREEAATALVAMHDAAEADGAGFRVSSAYRSYETQVEQHEGYVRQYGRTFAESISARPGYSEHQTGLTVDLFTTAADDGSQRFGATAAGRWLAAHAWEHGFVVSYPEGKEAVTGYQWEPWHVRYVGAEAARAMHDAGETTLQEFMGVEDSPDYG